mgnify:CR=1 FL=1
MSNRTRSTTPPTPTTLTPPVSPVSPVSPVWPNKSVDYDRALSLLADDLLALSLGHELGHGLGQGLKQEHGGFAADTSCVLSVHEGEANDRTR